MILILHFPTRLIKYLFFSNIMFTTRLQRFQTTFHSCHSRTKRQATWKEKKRKICIYIYTYLGRFYASNTRCFVRVTIPSRASTGNNSRRTKRHDTSGRRSSSSSFAFSAKCPAPFQYTVAALNFSAISNRSPKYRSDRNSRPERLVRLHIFHRARLILSRGAYDLRCTKQRIRLCIPPRLSTPRERLFPGTCLLYFCCFVFSFARLPGSLLNIAAPPITCYSVTNL